MEFRPKSSEHLQAQVEAFGDKGVKAFSDEQRKIFQHFAELSNIEDLDNLPSDLPPKAVEFIESHRQQYVIFLRQEKKEEIQFRKENAEYYKQTFQKAVKELRAKIDADGAKDQYLGSGSNGVAYRIVVGGKEYAAKFSKSITQANFEIKPLLRAKGIDHVAQLASYSFEDSVVIMELLHGTDVTKFRHEDAPEYSDDDITQLIETTIELNRNGIMIDPKPSNFIYDKEKGFSILDFHLKNSSYTLADSVMDLRIALMSREWPKLDWKADDYKEKRDAQAREQDKVYLPLMVRFLTILRDKFPEILADYKREYAVKESDPRRSQAPIINREYIAKNNPEAAPYLKKLEELGF